MQSATVRFQTDGILHKAEELPWVKPKASHDVGIDHPDARLIAAAPELLQMLEEVALPMMEDLATEYNFLKLGDTDIIMRAFTKEYDLGVAKVKELIRRIKGDK